MIWRAYEVNDATVYRLHLCQTPNGLRHLKLVAAGSDIDRNRTNEVIFATATVPNDLLKKRDIDAIVGSVKLENGDFFDIDAHHMWLTKFESSQLDSNVRFDEILWATDQPPQFAMK